MHGVVGEGGAQVYPKRSLTSLLQPNTWDFQLPQALQQGVHASKDTKSKVNSCDLGDTVGMCTNTAATSRHETA